MTNDWRTEMSLLANLKLTAAKKLTQTAPAVLRRNKSASDWLNRSSWPRQNKKDEFTVRRGNDGVADEQMREKRTVEAAKRMREWWWMAADGKKVNIALRYGAKVIEIAKGKTAIELQGNRS